MVRRISEKFRNTKFSPLLIREAKSRFLAGFDKDVREKQKLSLNIEEGPRTYSFESDSNGEEEFFEYLDHDIDYARYVVDLGHEKSLHVHYIRSEVSSSSTIEIEADGRGTILPLLDFFRDAAPDHHEKFGTEEREVSPKIFIGHGHSPVWRDLKDHLADHHGYQVLAYESGSRAGHTIRDILDDLGSKSNMALLVHTGDDEVGDGTRRARVNVVHETGLFQGKLGFNRAIVLLEEGCEAFSNIDGIQQIRFSKGKIREAFGDVLAVIRREFP